MKTKQERLRALHNEINYILTASFRGYGNSMAECLEDVQDISLPLRLLVEKVVIAEAMSLPLGRRLKLAKKARHELRCQLFPPFTELGLILRAAPLFAAVFLLFHGGVPFLKSIMAFEFDSESLIYFFLYPTIVALMFKLAFWPRVIDPQRTFYFSPSLRVRQQNQVHGNNYNHSPYLPEEFFLAKGDLRGAFIHKLLHHD